MGSTGRNLLRFAVILAMAWVAIYSLTLVLPSISPGWLPFLPVLYPTYSLIIRRRWPTLKRAVVAALAILAWFVFREWAFSHLPKAEAYLLKILNPQRWRFDVYVHEGECTAELGHNELWRWKLPPIWTFFVVLSLYPTVVLIRETLRGRDRVREISVICFSSAIFLIALCVHIMAWMPELFQESMTRDIVVEILAVPPVFLFLGSILGAAWIPFAMLLLRKRYITPMVLTTFITMFITGVVWSASAAILPIMVPELDEEGIFAFAMLLFGSGAFLVNCYVLRRRLPKLYPSGMCQQCGYNLTGNVSGICPECGTSNRTRSGSDEPQSGWPTSSDLG